MPTRPSISEFRPVTLILLLPLAAFACQEVDSGRKKASTTTPTATPPKFVDSLQSLGGHTSVCVALDDIEGTATSMHGPAGTKWTRLRPGSTMGRADSARDRSSPGRT